MRKRIADFLPAAITKAVESYEIFMTKSISEDSKIFSEHHKAAKVALGHLQLLIKLGSWANLPDEESAQIELAALYAEAQAELEDRGHDDDTAE